MGGIQTPISFIYGVLVISQISSLSIPKWLFGEEGAMSRWWYQYGNMKHNEDRPQQWVDLVTGKSKLSVKERSGIVPNLEEVGRKARLHYENVSVSKCEKPDGYIFAPAHSWIDAGLIKELNDDLRTLSFTMLLGTWMFGKMKYRFEPTIFEHLKDSEIDEVPVETIQHLPDWCVYVELPKDNGIFHNTVKGFFATYLRTDIDQLNNKVEGLTLVMDTVDFGLIQLIFMPLNFFGIGFRDIDDTISAYMAMKRKVSTEAIDDVTSVVAFLKYGYQFIRDYNNKTMGDKYNVVPEDFRKMVVCCLNLLLNLCVDDTDQLEESIVNQKHTYQKSNDLSGRSIKGAPKTRTIVVGKEFEKIHERAWREWRASPSSVRPHKRCAHYRRVRILVHPDKPGEYTRKTVWIPATFVRGHNYKIDDDGVVKRVNIL